MVDYKKMGNSANISVEAVDATSKRRNVGIDLLRIIACFLVILYHSRYEYTVINNIDRLIVTVSFFIGRIAVPLFFIMSGYFTIPSCNDTFGFLKKRFIRIVCPSLFWMVIYAIVLGHCSSNILLESVTLTYAPHLWYIYALIGLILFTPLIAPYLKNASIKELIFYLTIWGITLFFSKNTFTWFTDLEFTHNGFLFSKNPFHLLLNLYGYWGYFVLGMAARRIKFPSLPKKLIFVILGGVILTMNLVAGLSPSESIAYLSLPNAFISFGVFLIFNSVNIPSLLMSKVINKVAGFSFGIYLVHWLVFQLYYLYFGKGTNHLLLSIIVFIVSTIMCYLISQLKLKKYIIG